MRASDKAYAALREDIIEWRLAPGTVLAEVEQSERLGISRTPLREALSRLTAEGLTTTLLACIAAVVSPSLGMRSASINPLAWWGTKWSISAGSTPASARKSATSGGNSSRTNSLTARPSIVK